jgi:outer membrane protein assembly factor BamB
MPLPRSSTWPCLVFAAVVLGGLETPPAFADLTSPAKLVTSTEPGWPQFRGPRRDGICDERGLLASWPEGGPKVLWSANKLGNGYSSPIIAGGRIYITGDVGDELHLFALDLKGQPIWQAKNGAAWKQDYPGARASVAYQAGHIYHHNAHGRVACFDAANGKEVWALEVLEKFGAKNITWGLSECLLVDDRAVYVTAGGSGALVIALDRKTGDLIWKSTPISDSEGEQAVETPSYVSPILVDFAGRKLLIGCSLKHLFCVDAATGKLQWTRRLPTRYSVLAMMPVFIGPDRIFMTAPHGTGGHCYQLTPPSDPNAPIGANETWTSKLDTCQGGVIHSGGKLFGPFYSDRKGWAALNASNGEVIYTNTDFAKGAALLADGRLYALAEDGWMLLLEPTEKEFAVKGRFRLAETTRRDAWAHPVIHQGRLYLRYHEVLTCYDVKAN